MSVRSADQIRDEFIAFFEGKKHTAVPSSPVVPHDDPTLMFTNAGMNQFKDVFLGTGSRSYNRAVDTQKCIRAGGKHNDLDDVGHDTYHHTFFEMLGNWSFGDYFKTEAIEWAWELLTNVWKLDPHRLHATYFEGDAAEGVKPDEEARELWARFLPPEQIHAGNKKDNFWEMGDTGPCGPCSEIHYDLTPDKSGASLVNAGDPRVIEIWNLVFIQFNRAAGGKLSPLPAKHVDTGMGFERIVAVLQAKNSNYDTDIFTPIFEGIQHVTGAKPYGGRLEEKGGRDPDLMRDIAYRVVADHIRCLTFALTDGAVPSNEGRGYVLRRILRRAVRYGRQYLGTTEPFLYKLVQVVVDAMRGPFPELKQQPGRVTEIIRDEEESFSKTLDRGIALFDEAAKRAEQQNRTVSGEDAFKLHDTYGFPIDLTQVMADEKGLKVDLAAYETLMDEAREKARASGSADIPADFPVPDNLPKTNDLPKYEALEHQSTMAAILQDGELVTSGGLQAGASQTVALILEATCAYAEQGGQVGDQGEIVTPTGKFQLETTRRARDCVLHLGSVVEGSIEVGQSATVKLSPQRKPVMENHTATHVLNWALREVLGEHVQQKGSLVDDEKTRFDFSHQKGLTPDELGRIEELCGKQIAGDLKVYWKEVPQADALKINGLRAVFGEKYPDIVRVVSVGVPVDDLLGNPDNADWRKYSVEFCGGTHVASTREIGRFVLAAEESVAKGIRRVVGLTGERAADAVATGDKLLQRADQLRSSAPGDVDKGLGELQKDMNAAQIPIRMREQLREAIADLQKIVKQQQKEHAAAATGVIQERIAALIADAQKVGDSAIVVGEVPDVPADQIKHGADTIKQKCGSAAIFLGARSDGKAVLLAAMTDDLIQRGLKAGDLVKHIAPIVKGGGGGPPTMAQAGGKDPDALPDALTAAAEWIQQKLG